MEYADHVYEIIIQLCGYLDSIYGDYIESLVGTIGLLELVKNGYVESCGVVNGRKLYVLVDRGY